MKTSSNPPRLSTKEKRARRQKIAQANLLLRNKRTPEQQLMRLDELLGKNVGARKERKRLYKSIKENNKSKK